MSIMLSLLLDIIKLKIKSLLPYFMCLQVPGKVVSLKGNKAIIDYDIEKRTAFIADIRPKLGDWVIVVGRFVVDIVPEENAKSSLEHWKKTMLD